jgi:hypothetical protein
VSTLELLADSLGWFTAPIAMLLGALLAWVLGRRRTTTPATPVDTSAADEKREEEIRLADAERVRKLEEIRAEHKATIEELTETQKAHADELVDDPEALNAWLKEVGGRIGR